VPFVGLWLDAAESELVARSERRVFDASDADAAVIRSQIAQGAGSMAWHRLDASFLPEDVLQKAILVLAERLKGGTIRSDSRAA
jgi:predicted kinase